MQCPVTFVTPLLLWHIRAVVVVFVAVGAGEQLDNSSNEFFSHKTSSESQNPFCNPGRSRHTFASINTHRRLVQLAVPFFYAMCVMRLLETSTSSDRQTRHPCHDNTTIPDILHPHLMPALPRNQPPPVHVNVGAEHGHHDVVV